MDEEYVMILPDELFYSEILARISEKDADRFYGEQMGEECLTNLPHELFCSQILSRLPLKDAVGFSAVSRNWRRSWTQLPQLKFSQEFFDPIIASASKGNFLSKLTRVDMTENIIDKIIRTQRMECATLESFELHNCERFGSSIDNWLLCISSSGVKYMNLKRLCSHMEVSGSLFLCVTLASLSLTNFMVTEIPAQFKGFPLLVTCHLEKVDLSKKAFETILSLCSLLESLTLSKCLLPSKLRIVSSSLKSLVLIPQGDEICSMEAICPKLETIQIILRCRKLVNVNLFLPLCVHLETGFSLLKHFVTVKSLKKITFFKTFFKNVLFADLEHLQTFPCLEELCIECTNFADYPDKVRAELTPRLPNLKIFTMNVEWYKRYDVLLCSWILKGAPHLKTVIIGGVMNYGVDRAFEIANAFLSVASAFPKAKISLRQEVIVSPGRR